MTASRFWSWNNEWKALSVGKREEHPNMDGNVLARRIASQSGRGLLTGKTFFFFPQLVYWLIYTCLLTCSYADRDGCSRVCLPSRVRVQLSNNGWVRVVHLRHFSGLHGFGSHFQIKYGSGSVPCSIFTGLFGFGYEFLDPWRPLHRSNATLSLGILLYFLFFIFFV